MTTDQTQQGYATILPTGQVAVSEVEPFRFNIVPGGPVFELPALGSKDIPLALIPVFLAVAGGQIDNDEDKMRAAGTFIAFIQEDEPKLWRALKPYGIEAVVALIREWGNHSRLDPQPPASGL